MARYTKDLKGNAELKAAYFAIIIFLLIL